MKVKQLQLQNYGRFDDLTMEFAPNGETKGNVTIIVGNNGAGKSQILQALATGFSWFVGGIKNKSDGFEIDKKFIKNGFNDTCVNMYVDFNKFNYKNPLPFDDVDKKETKWRFMTVKDGRNSFFKNQKHELDKVIENYRENLTDDINLSLPLIIYYPVERSVIGNSQADILSSDFEQFDAYFACTDGFGIDFYDFFKWFKQKEDLENEKQRYSSQQLSKLLEIFEKNKGHQILDGIIDNIQNIEIGDRLLNEVREAIERFTDFKNIRIERQGTPKMVVEKDGEKLDVNQLSQGEKSLLALVGDIARRLAILNPSLDNPLQGEGVVLIDEVDLHLHPKWQQNLIDKLTKTFPNVQFILTTHSPHIVSDNPDVLVYALDDGQLHKFGNVYGEDVNTLLNDVFDVSRFTPEIDKKFNDIRRAISHQELDNAESLINHLAQEVSPNHTELLKMRLMLAQAKLTLNQAD
ncbi:AAA family ATPase [Faucicola boevrei]|uniref:AAA family ATPase n=1 Tax=Faucicola boevrei TaxID=346665 RepID=UPI0003654060|nr:AAA family ATPase [Moraxella boevrei]